MNVMMTKAEKTDFETRSTRPFVIALFALHAFVITAIIVKSSPWLTGDSLRYLALADSLRNGIGFGLNAGGIYEPEGWRMPGYPALIAICQMTLGLNRAALVTVQGLLVLASVGMVYLLASKCFGKCAALIFLVLSSIYPFIAHSAVQISAEAPALFFVSLAYYSLSSPKTWRFAFAGLAIGLASYFRPNLLFLSIAVAGAIVMASRRAFPKACILVIAAGLTVLPWAIRNHVVFHHFTPTPAIKGSGTSLLLATWQSRVSVDSLVNYGMRGRVTAELRDSGMLDQISALNRRIGMPEDTVFITPEAYPGNAKKQEADRLFTETALDNIKKWPLTYLLSSTINMARMWFSAYLSGFPPLIRAAFLVEGVVVLLAGVLGGWKALRHCNAEHRTVIYAIVGGLLYFTLTLCWLHTEARYTIPIRLLLLALAGYSVMHVRKHL